MPSEKFANELHKNMWDNVVFAEQKGAFAFVASSGLLVYLNQIGEAKSWVSRPCTWTFQVWIAFVATLCLVLAACFVIMVVFPRFPKAKSLFYWRGISESGSESAYVEHFMARTERELEEAVVAHSYQLSRVAKSKYQWLRYAIIAGSIGGLLTLLLGAIVKGKSGS
ncbi:Pycsar system effector family protein [Terriglobus roseus]|nr:Pycsar system effector family protein [Terriglobus roseus]